MSASPPVTLAAAFEAEYAGLVRLARLLTSPSEAEDVVQTAFMKVFRRGPLADPDAITGYLRRTVVNVARSRHRSELRALDHERRAAGPDAESPPDVASRLAIHQALAALPRRQREAVVLRYYADLTEADAAEVMSVSVGSVKAYTSRGLDQLAVLLCEDSS